MRMRQCLKKLRLYSQINDSLVVFVLGKVRAKSLEHVLLGGGLKIMAGSVAIVVHCSVSGGITRSRSVKCGRKRGARRCFFVARVINFLKFDILDFVYEAEASPSDDFAENNFLECQCRKGGRGFIQRGRHSYFVGCVG